MSSSCEVTPLLPQTINAASGRVHREPKLFMRICHSPWKWIPQFPLLCIRGLVLAFLLSTWIAALVRDATDDDHSAALFVFEAGRLSYTLQLVYYVTAVIWTSQHLESPQNRPPPPPPPPEGPSRSFRDRALSLISIPRTTEFSESQRLRFSIFYSAANTFPFVVSFVYWCFLRGGPDCECTHRSICLDTHASAEDSRPGAALDELVVFSLFVVNSMIAAVETLALSSIVKFEPFDTHWIALGSIVVVYFFWAMLGRAITGTWVYDRLDFAYHGGREIFTNVAIPFALVLAVFSLSAALHGLRDWLARGGGRRAITARC